MRKAHREAAKALYEERNKHLVNGGLHDEELYVDLHGKHFAFPCSTYIEATAADQQPPTQACTQKKPSPT